MAHVTNPKPEPRKRAKGRKDRQEARVKKSVREQVDERDGYCVIQNGGFSTVGKCEGLSEWAHIGRHRRSLTRGMAPERRHTTAGSAKMCHKHHAAYDAHRFDLVMLSDDGMNGYFAVKTL